MDHVTFYIGRKLKKTKPRQVKSYTIFGTDIFRINFKELFCNHIIQDYSDTLTFSCALLKSYKSNVRDNEAEIARKLILLTHPEVKNLKIKVSELYIFEKEKEITEEFKRKIHNPLIHDLRIIQGNEKDCFAPLAMTDGELSLRGAIATKQSQAIQYYPADLSLTELEKINKERLLALNTEELKAIWNYFNNEKIQNDRERLGLSHKITDAELECIAQTWSEHCKHKIMNATIEYDIHGKKETINSLFKTYIKKATEELKKDYLISVFTDNSGVITLDDEHDICFKVETHNSPSALDPYGGASTGIVGVYRDILGTGLGAKPIFGTNILCFDSKNRNNLIEGIVKGIEDGGNQSGIPTVNGACLYDESYYAKPLVFCGAGGILPKGNAEKKGKAGDRIIILGGRVGRDGIHGATFSSLSLTEDSPASAVQIADPYTQRILGEALLEARDRGLITSLTDNGAGGFSSSIGELARDIGGAHIDLSRALLKDVKILPWEILISESQERMTVATDKPDEFARICEKHGVEYYDIGEFTRSGYVHVVYGEKTVAYLDLEFLHAGNPVLNLKAEKPTIEYTKARDLQKAPREIIQKLLQDPNIASKEKIFSRYDAEVKAQTILKEYVGYSFAGPTDGAILAPLLGKDVFVTITNGVKPWIRDPYQMALYAVDEAVRNTIAIGGNLDRSAMLDNFSFPDPLRDKKMLGSLVENCRGLYDAAKVYEIPLISGKDSMKNDAIINGDYYAVLPTLLISMMSVFTDVKNITTPDFKNDGDIIFLIGESSNKLGGSAYERNFDHSIQEIPGVLLEKNNDLYRTLSSHRNLFHSLHDVSDGGALVAIIESALGGNRGVELIINDAKIMFSEPTGTFIVSIEKDRLQEFQETFKKFSCIELGIVCGKNIRCNFIENKSWNFSMTLEETRRSYIGANVYGE